MLAFNSHILQDEIAAEFEEAMNFADEWLL